MFKSNIADINWHDFITNNLNVYQNLEAFVGVVITLLEENFPEKKVNIKVSKKPWFKTSLNKKREMPDF